MFEIRWAKVADADEIAGLMNLCLAETDYLIRAPFKPYNAEMIRKEIELCETVAPFTRLIAVNEGSVAGDLMFWANTRLKIRHAACISMCVQKSHWNMGIGTALLQCGLLRAREAGLKKLYMEVSAKNERAISFYKKSGFIEESRKGNIRRNNQSAHADIIWLRAYL